MKILYIDMDGVLADFDAGVKLFCPDLHTIDYHSSYDKVHEVCEANPKIFHTLPVIEGAVEAVHKLFKLYDVLFLSTPMWRVPDSFTGKRIWLDTHFGLHAEERLILTPRKDLSIGDYLVDDTTRRGVDKFTGEHIHFRTPRFPDWEITYNYLEKKANG